MAMPIAVVTIAAIAAAAGQSTSTDLYPGFCPQLSGIVAAARERPPFGSLEQSPRMTGNFAWTCVYSGLGEHRRLTCEWRAPPASDLWHQLNAAIERCFPRAIRMAEASETVARYRFGSIVIHTQHRSANDRAGSYVSYTVFRLPVHR